MKLNRLMISIVVFTAFTFLSPSVNALQGQCHYPPDSARPSEAGWQNSKKVWNETLELQECMKSETALAIVSVSGTNCYNDRVKIDGSVDLASLLPSSGPFAIYARGRPGPPIFSSDPSCESGHTSSLKVNATKFDSLCTDFNNGANTAPREWAQTIHFGRAVETCRKRKQGSMKQSSKSATSTKVNQSLKQPIRQNTTNIPTPAPDTRKAN